MLGRAQIPATGDPVADLDAELARLVADLRAVRARGEPQMAARLADVIDRRLDQRRSFTADPDGPYCP